METQQEIFTECVKGLAAQGWVRSTVPSGHLCLYRDSEGRGCAVGVLMADEEADLVMRLGVSNAGVEILYRTLRDKAPSWLNEGNLAFLQSLQDTHDSVSHELRDGFVAFAQRNGFDWPEGV